MNSPKPIKGLLLSYFKPEDIEVWTDPYNSIPLKLWTVIIYIIELWASTIMLIFVSYEMKGLFGHYRTVINQLLSFGYGAVRYLIIQYMLDFLRDMKDWTIAETCSSLKKSCHTYKKV